MITSPGVPARDTVPFEDADTVLEDPAAAPPEALPGQVTGDGAFAFLAVFRHRNYRLFFMGQLVSLMGTWIMVVAQGWLVYSLTHSPLLLGLVAFAGQVPVFFFAAFGGMIADRFERRRLLLFIQWLAMLESVVLAVLIFEHMVAVWMVVALALFQGFLTAFDVPVRQSMTIDMVGRADLRYAISLNSVMFNLARVTGPGIAGLIIAAVGVGWCFAIDAISYGAVLVGLVLMRFPPRVPRPHAQPLRAVAEGVRYTWRTREIRVSILLVSACSAFGASYISLMPAFARDVLHQGSEGLGLLYSATGLGALAGAYTLARVPDRRLFATPVVAAFCFGLSVILFSQSRWFGVSLLVLVPSAFALMLLGGSTNTLVQLLSREDMRGRVVALYVMGFLGMMPWGSLLLGWLAESIGTSLAVTVGGALCMLAAVAAYYDRRGAAWRLTAE